MTFRLTLWSEKMAVYREDIIKTAEKYIGCKESNGTHKKIIDRYNAHKPLARGYKVKYSDAWCATFGSAVAIECNATHIIPTECGCDHQIALFKKLGEWVENDAYIPVGGEYIFYDWDDSGKGDNKGDVEHVGIVQKVVGNVIYVIEGNYSNSVKVRQLAVNGKYIRGYGVPKYDVKPTSAPKESSAIDYAQDFDKSLAGKYITTSGLNLRTGAGTSKSKVTVMPKGAEVQCYGYYTKVGSTKWYLVVYKNYTGFCSSKYLKKK